MTNPSDAVGTNGAYGGRTSVDALNDVLGCFQGSGTLSGWYVRADSGMSVLVGGQSGVRDVAVAEDQLGDRTTVNNRLGSPISITLNASSPSTARVDSIVLYVNKPASVITTDIDNPGACGIIAVNGTMTAPSGADIRSAITADGGTGATAYYVVIADITIPASATVITNTNITNYNSGLIGRRAMAAGAIGTDQLANAAVTSDKIDLSTFSYLQLSYYDSSEITIPGADYTPLASGTITTHGGRLFFTGFIVGTLSGSIAYFKIKVDNTEYRVSQSNITSANLTMPGSIVVAGLSAGSHSVSFGVQVQQTTRNYKVSGYTWLPGTFIEF